MSVVRESSRPGGREAAGIATLGALAIAFGCGGQPAALGAPRHTIRIDRAAYTAVRRLEPEMLARVCGPGTVTCPRGDLTAGAVAWDGVVAVASRVDGIQMFPPGAPRRSVVLHGTSVSGSERASVLSADGDSGWRFLDGRSPRYLRVSRAGEVRSIDAARLTSRLAGFSAADSIFAMWLVSPGDYVGDPVVSEFRAAGPPSLRGKRLASVTTPAIRIKSSDGRPLPPFFGRSPSWCVMADGRIVYSPGDSLSLLTADTTGAVVQVVVDAPRRRVSDAEMSAAINAWMRTAGNPNSTRLRKVMLDDAERRRLESSAYHSSVVSLRCFTDGRIGAEGPLDLATDSTRWDLFLATGSPAGYFRVAGTDRVLALHGDTLLLARVMPGGTNEVILAALRP